MNKEVVIKDDWIESKCGWTPFNNYKVTGFPTTTIINGEVVMENNEIISEAKGQPLKFKKRLVSRLIKLFNLLRTIIFNKQILTFYYKNKLSKWVERPIHFKKVKINYPNNFEIEEIQIKNRDRYHYANIFVWKKLF